MVMIAGLGNPGREYQGTRHNIGFDVIDELIDREGIPSSGVKYHAMYGTGIIQGQKVVLVKPLSYMNLSGDPIRQLAAYYRIDPEKDLIVVCDDINLMPGQIRIRKGGSAGGHNGMKSIISSLGTQQFTRVRIGVGSKPSGYDLADYVLGHFSSAERREIDEAVKDAADAVAQILSEGVDTAMNRFNKKRVPDPQV
ncbi:MAG: aminoacyl-tRNA hydrolase [Blautia sp.]|nr:aminoacyl-tRNA hydrolase [Blautia sp.]